MGAVTKNHAGFPGAVKKNHWPFSGLPASRQPGRQGSIVAQIMKETSVFLGVSANSGPKSVPATRASEKKPRRVRQTSEKNHSAFSGAPRSAAGKEGSGFLSLALVFYTSEKKPRSYIFPKGQWDCYI